MSWPSTIIADNVWKKSFPVLARFFHHLRDCRCQGLNCPRCSIVRLRRVKKVNFGSVLGVVTALFYAADVDAALRSVHTTRRMMKYSTTLSLKNLIVVSAACEIHGLSKTQLVRCFTATIENLSLRFLVNGTSKVHQKRIYRTDRQQVVYTDFVCLARSNKSDTSDISTRIGTHHMVLLSNSMGFC